MIRVFLFVIALMLYCDILLASSQSHVPPSCTTGKSAELAPLLKSVVGVLGENSGSGVAVSPTEVLTNAHVVGVSTGVILTTCDWVTIPGTVVWSDRKLDRALIRSEIPLPAYSTIRTAPLVVLERVSSVGHPRSASPWSISHGVVVAVRIKNNFPGGAGYFILASTQTGLGSSGGALFDADGNLIGITSNKTSVVVDQTGGIIGLATQKNALEPGQQIRFITLARPISDFCKIVQQKKVKQCSA